LVASSDGYHGTKATFTYDSKQHLVKSVETVLSGAEEIRHYRYDGDRLVHEDDKLDAEFTPSRSPKPLHRDRRNHSIAITENTPSRSVARPIGRDHVRRSEVAGKLGATWASG
jgi:hypothetical protein